MQTHYHITPRELEGDKDACWRDLADYLQKHAMGNAVFFREVPQVFSELHFDTKQVRHRGVVRFSCDMTTGYIPEIPSLGSVK